MPRTAGLVSAHPVSGHPHVDVPLGLVVSLALLLVLVVALLLPARPPRPAAEPHWSFAGSLTTTRTLVRVLALATVGLCIVAGRIGADDELDNLAPALVVGTAWPVLVLTSAALGPVWRWVDPWDTVARLLDRDRAPGPAADHVWPAVGVALAMVWYLSAYTSPLSVRSVGTALAVYAITMVAGCVAFGRARWLSSADPVGITLTWMGMLPRRRLAGWAPPRGADVLVGVLVGGLLFGLVRRSIVWSGFIAVPGALLYATAGVMVLAGLFGGTFALVTQLARSWDGGAAVARAGVPALAGTIVAVGLERNRLFTSTQLLPGLAGDPLGLGWDLLGPSVDGLDPDPLGAVGLIALQLGLAVLGTVIGAGVAARRVERRSRRLPATLLMGYIAVALVVTIVLH